MTALQSWLRTIGILAVCGCVSWAFYVSGRAMQAWGAAAPDLAPTLAQTSSVLTHADTAVNNLADATGDWSAASKQQARDVRAALAASGRLLDATTEDAKALKPAIVAVQGTAQEATEAIGEGKRTIAAAQPLLASLTRNSDDINAVIRDNAPSLHLTLENVQGMTGSGSIILANTATVSTKAKDDYMKARTPWGKFVTTGLDLIHLGAYAAR